MRGVTKKTIVEPEVPWFRGFVGFREIQKNSSVFEIVIFREGSLGGKKASSRLVCAQKKRGVVRKRKRVSKNGSLFRHQEEGFFLAPVFFSASRGYEI